MRARRARARRPGRTGQRGRLAEQRERAARNGPRRGCGELLPSSRTARARLPRRAPGSLVRTAGGPSVRRSSARIRVALESAAARADPSEPAPAFLGRRRPARRRRDSPVGRTGAGRRRRLRELHSARPRALSSLHHRVRAEARSVAAEIIRELRRSSGTGGCASSGRGLSIPRPDGESLQPLPARAGCVHGAAGLPHPRPCARARGGRSCPRRRRARSSGSAGRARCSRRGGHRTTRACAIGCRCCGSPE